MSWRPFAFQTRSTLAGALAALLLSGTGHAESDAEFNARAHDLFKELIEINTTDSAGSVTAASEAMARRLREAGYRDEDIWILGPNDRKKNVVVRLRGTGKHKPVLLIGHLDVVEARREDWTSDPFEFVEKDGHFFGRGTQDMKNGDAIMMATLIRLKKEGFRPARDIVLALTADEESGSSNGVQWLLKNHRDLVDAEFVINLDGNSITSDHGKPVFFEMDATEKVYGDFLLTATNPGGHSSLPVPDNAIYRISAALNRLARYDFPFELNAVTRGYYERMSTIETGERAADMKAILQTPPDPRPSSDCLAMRWTTPRCARRALRPAWRAGTPTMRCPRGRRQPSTAAYCRGIRLKRSGRSSSRCLPIPGSGCSTSTKWGRSRMSLPTGAVTRRRR